MRRAVLAIGGSAAGLVAVLTYKSGAPPALHLAARSNGSTATRGAGDAPSTTETTTTEPTTESTTTPATTAPTQRPTRLKDGTVDGQTVAAGEYGDVQVRVTIRAGRITDVQAVQLPSDRPRSQSISFYSAPTLRREVLVAQNAQIDTVSGATYTSQAYADSVQSALDNARG